MQPHNHKIKTNRVNWIDYTKFIGIYFVVLGHIANDNLGSGLLIWIYSFHMPLFFFISGYLLNENDSIKQTLIKGFKTLIIPYISFYILTLLVELFLLYFFAPPFFEIPFNELLSKITLGLLIGEGRHTQHSISHNHYLWFLLGLFFCKIIVQFAFLKKDKIYTNLTIIILLSFFLTYILVRTQFEIYWSIDSAIMGVPFYIFGYLFSKFDKQKEYSFSTKISLSLILLFLSIMLNKYGNNTARVDMVIMAYGPNIFLFYLNGAIGSLAIIFIAKTFSERESKLSLYIGQNTLIVLCTHRFAIIILRDILLEKIIKKKIPFSFNYLHIEEIVIAFLVLLVLVIPIYLIRNYFPAIIGSQQIKKQRAIY